MTMASRPNNPLAARKQQVRRHSRNILLAAGALGVGVVWSLLSWAWTPVLLLGIFAVAFGGYHAAKIKELTS